jgi:hypothetical protein
MRYPVLQRYCQLVAGRREFWPREGAVSSSTGARHLAPDGEGAAP